MKLACYSKESIYSTLVLSLLMLCGFYIRVASWPDYYFTSDDLWHLVMAKQGSVMGVIKANLAEDVHPPLSYLILHFMLKISDNQYFLRCISLVPGVLLIPMIYLLGKERIGMAGATVMAFLVTFGEWTTLLSSAIRGYSLMLLCITFALWAMYRFDKTHVVRYVWGYFIAMFLAIELVHSVAFFIFATGSWWFLKNIRRKEMWKFLFWWGLGHAVLMACILLYLNALEYKVMPHYFGGAYFQGPKELLFFYCSQFLVFLQGNTSTTLAGVFIGMFICFLQIFTMPRRAGDILYLFSSIYALLIIGEYWAIFPFGYYMRNYIFWVIPVYMVLGIVIHIWFNKLLSMAMRYAAFSRWMMPLLVLILGGIITLLVVNARQQEYYRLTYSGYYEASIPEEELHNALSFLEKNVRPGDIIVTSAETMWFLRYIFDSLPIIRHNGNVAETELFSTPVYFDGRPARIYNQYFTPYTLQEFFEHLGKVTDYSKVRKVWFLHLGWSSDMIAQLMKVQLVPPRLEGKCFWEGCNEIMYELAQEGYALSWKFIMSPNIRARFAYYNYAGAAVVYGETPNFIQEVLLNQNFMNKDKILIDKTNQIASKRFRIKHE